MLAPGPLLTVTRLRKSYATVVLDDVDLEVNAGEVHALIGENGAGKSTLARILAGVTPPNGGQVRLNGQVFAPRDRAAANRAGVRLVMQELNLVGNLSVAENIFFDRLPHRFGWIHYARLHRDTREVLALVGLETLAPECPVRSLGIGQQQMIEIAAGLSRKCRLLILDEPTAALSDAETELLFHRLAGLKAAGVGLLYISHRLEEIQRIADRITVLRDGKKVGTHAARALDRREMIRLMVGRDLAETTPRPAPPKRTAALRAVDLRRGEALRGVSFTAHYGEILGFAGLLGSGRTETMRAIFGADPLDAGEIYLDESPRPAGIRKPADAVRQGIAFLTEDRKGQGLLLPLPVRANITITNLPSVSGPAGWIRAHREHSVAQQWAEMLSVRCASLEQPVAELSGGNQQKIVIAKWLNRDCRILLFDEPTRGIDVAAKFDIYRGLAELAGRGKAVLVVSSDLEELMFLCDRIAVMSGGRIAAVFGRSEWGREKILAAALSEDRRGAATTPIPAA